MADVHSGQGDHRLREADFQARGIVCTLCFILYRIRQADFQARGIALDYSVVCTITVARYSLSPAELFKGTATIVP